MSGRDADPFDAAAGPVLDWAGTLSRLAARDPKAALTEAVARLDGFSEVLRRGGAPPAAIAPARYALALILDQNVRGNRRVDMKLWSAAAHRQLFDGREISTATLRDFIDKAQAAGPEYAPVHGFLERCLGRLEGGRTRFDRSTGPSWTGIVAVLVVGFCFAVAGWTAWVEWRFHRDLTQVFEADALAIGLDRTGDIADLAQRLDRLRDSAARVAEQTGHAPIRFFAGPLGFDAAGRAAADYESAVQQHLPSLIARQIDIAIASEGDAVALYDDLRAWSVLSGLTDWSPAYLAGWIADRSGSGAALDGIAAHAMRLRPPDTSLPQPDGELLAQARNFAAEAAEADRAFLELRRSDDVAALPGWVADIAVPGLSATLQRRSGQPIAAPLPGLFTTAGWDHARDIGAGNAVQTARAEAAKLFANAVPRQNDAPDRVMDMLQRDTIAVWRAYLADLRVRPFSDADTAVRISGELARASSPLERLLSEVWAQAGGLDRRRTHGQQLAIATRFAAMIQYVEQGRMRDISGVFAGLNVALGAMDRDEETGLQRLMSVQERAASISALRQAPAVVTGIVEDVLAQSSAAHADLLTNPLTRAWQAEVLPACRAAIDGLYPFGEGGDADPAQVARLLAPGGAIDRYLQSRAAPYIDMTENPWRWKPEARFAGLAPESAVFFQTAKAITASLFAADGAIGDILTLAALAERGKATMAIGGQGGAVEATGDALVLRWPGPTPERGVEVSFQTGADQARIEQGGPWGLLRLLDPLRLRKRDDGQRILVDLRQGSARLFLEIGLDRPDNPLSRRDLLKGFACPPVL